MPAVSRDDRLRLAAGNAEGAVGDWDAARRHYLMAAEDSELSAIASANYALASFEAGDTSGAIRSARQLLRRWATVMP